MDVPWHLYFMALSRTIVEIDHFKTPRLYYKNKLQSKVITRFSDGILTRIYHIKHKPKHYLLN